jgi:hypothetical protein
MPDLVSEIRQRLDRLTRSRAKDNDQFESAHDELQKFIATHSKKEVLEALPKAIGNKESRQKESVFVLSLITDEPGAIEALGQLAEEADDELMRDILESVRFYKLSQLAPLVISVLKSDRPTMTVDFAIGAATALRHEEAFRILVEMSRSKGTNHVRALTIAFKDFARPEGRAFLEHVFNTYPEPLSLKIWAAWGLGKLGDAEPVDFLIRCISGEISMTTNPDPIRAAQAICDIKKLPFSWSAKAPEKTLARLKSQTD